MNKILLLISWIFFCHSYVSAQIDIGAWSPERDTCVKSTMIRKNARVVCQGECTKFWFDFPACASKNGRYNKWYLSTSATSPARYVSDSNGTIVRSYFANLVDSSTISVDDTFHLCASQLATYGVDSFWVILGHYFGDEEPGRTAHAWFKIYLQNSCSVTAAFSKSQSRICMPEQLLLNNESYGDDTSWQWYFNGGSPAVFYGQNPPAITYATPGKYEIKLIVRGISGIDSLSDSIAVYPSPAASSATQQYSVAFGDSLQLSACASGNVYAWTPSITTDSATNYLHPADTFQRYTCRVTNTFGCATNCYYEIRTLPVAKFTANKKTLCQEDSVRYANTSIGTVNSSTWYFDGGTPAGFTGKTPPYIIYKTPGKYAIKLVVTNTNGNDSIIDSIQVNPAPFISPVTQSYSIKQGDSIQLKACQPGNTYSWSGNISTDSVTGYLHPAMLSETYRCAVGNNFGCRSSCVYIINKLPTALISAFLKEICVSNYIQFTDSSYTADNWEWYFEGGSPTTFIGKSPPKVTYTTAGKFLVQLIATNVNGADTFKDSITVHARPVSSGIIQEYLIPYGDSIRLGACVSGSTYQWSPGTSTDSLSEYYYSQVTDNKYACTIANEHGCTALCEYVVRVTPLARFVLDSVKICVGQKNEVYNQSGRGVYWDWFFEGGTPETSDLRDPDPVAYKKAGKFLVRLITWNSNGRDTFTQTVEVSDLPVVPSTMQEFSVDVSKSFRLKACTKGARYEWKPSMTSDSITPDLYLSEASKEYMCSVYLESGCSVICRYNVIAEKTGLFMPNAFSPNGDGINEIFEPVGMGITSYELTIYNSWGVLVSKTSDTGWDGKTENVFAPPGTYLWTLSYKQNANKLGEILYGTVLLTR